VRRGQATAPLYKMKIRFVKDYGKWKAGDVTQAYSGFARRLIRAKYAVPFEHLPAVKIKNRLHKTGLKIK